MRTVAIIHHRVVDFDEWRAVYDTADQLRREGGVHEHAVLRSPEDRAMVVVVHTFADAAAARAFLARDDLREAMGRAGVDPSSVHVEMLDEVQAGPVAGG